MTVEDQKYVYEYLKLNAPQQEAELEVKKASAHGDATFANEQANQAFAQKSKMIFNLDQLSKLVDCLAKEYFFNL